LEEREGISEEEIDNNTTENTEEELQLADPSLLNSGENPLPEAEPTDPRDFPPRRRENCLKSKPRSHLMTSSMILKNKPELRNSTEQATALFLIFLEESLTLRW
jgi:hypothetical protein